MKNLKKLLGFAVVFMVMMAFFSSVGFAADIQYTENLIPTMTSNTVPSGIASASNSYAATLAPWKAFDKNGYYNTNNVYSAWGTANTSGWLSYEFPSSQIINKYTINTNWTNTGGVYCNPSSWTFEGWDGKIWAILDTRSNISWVNSVKKEFVFNNTTSYTKYRINISANCGSTSNSVNLAIGELEMMGPATSKPQAPTNLTIASVGNKEVKLTWDSVEGATSYNIKRSTVSGKEDTIATTSSSIYTDTGLVNGTTYYYVVTAVNATGESAPSNEVSATPENPAVTLEVTSVDKAKVRDLITANVIIHNAINICAEDIKLSYDTSRLEFVSAEGADGIKVYKESDISAGVKRYITSSLGKANAANGDKVLLKLTFKAKAVGEAKIDITNGRIADNATLEMDVEEANCGEKTVLIEGIKDVNRSDEFTLLDLGIDAWYYGDAVADTDTSKYDTDVVENGTIDDADLSKIVEEMLNNPNYPALAKI